MDLVFCGVDMIYSTVRQGYPTKDNRYSFPKYSIPTMRNPVLSYASLFDCHADAALFTLNLHAHIKLTYLPDEV